MLDLLYPARCPICKDVIPLKDRLRLYEDGGSGIKELYRAYVCPVCLKEIDFITMPYCRKCGRKLAAGAGAGAPRPGRGAGPAQAEPARASGRPIGRPLAQPLVDEAASGLCAECQKRPRAFTQARCVMSYDELAQELIADLKYKGHKDFAPFLSILAADTLGEWVESLKVDAIVPVPVHERRLRERGYNQAALIAHGIGKLLDIPVDEAALWRRKNTKASKNLGADARLLNLQGAFAADLKRSPLLSRLESPTILIVDDIFTTGMTLNICSETLLRSGASRVYGLIIAAGRDISKDKS